MRSRWWAKSVQSVQAGFDKFCKIVITLFITVHNTLPETGTWTESSCSLWWNCFFSCTRHRHMYKRVAKEQTETKITLVWLHTSYKEWKTSCVLRPRPTGTLWIRSCACTAAILASCRGTWKTRHLRLAPLPNRCIRASIHHRINRVWVRGSDQLNVVRISVTCAELGTIFPPNTDAPAVPESSATPGHGLSEQRQSEHRTQPAPRRRGGEHRHRYHRGAGWTEGAAGPDQKQSEFWNGGTLLKKSEGHSAALCFK